MFEVFIIPVSILAVSGIVVTAILFTAAKYMAVPVDEKQELVREALPGANCGACGYSGCDGYAEAVAKGEAAPNLCIPAGAAGGEKIAEIMGLSFEGVDAKKAFVKCHGSCDKTHDKMEYVGVDTCEACSMLYGGNSSCDYGCLGFGDCAAACAFGAITIKDGIAHVNKDLCTGCEACTAVCPKHIIEMMPENQKVKVACSSKAMPKAAMQSCKVSCIACKKCERSCEFDAIHVNDFLAKIDPEKCTACGKCVEACPNNCITQNW